MKIAVVGAGGVGGYYGGVLARAGNPVTLLARGEHLAAIRERGLEVCLPDNQRFVAGVSAVESANEIAEAELVLVTVKSYSLGQVAPAIRLLSERGAMILPLLNGVETIEQLVSSGVREAQVLGGLTTISVVKIAPGIIERRSSFAKLIVGEPKGGLSPRVERIIAAFIAAGVDARSSAYITLDLWRKFAFIATVAAACGLSRTPIGAVREAPFGSVLLERSVREIAAVGRARGVAFSEKDIEQTLATIASLAPEIKPSFLLDLEHGGPTELNILSGAVSRIGRESNVDTPIHETTTAALTAAMAGGRD
jgi:2-dehydropantoate 2-reductase